MKFCSVRFGLARSLVALVVSFGLVLSTHFIAFASPAKSAAKSPRNLNSPQTSAGDSQSELQITSASAIVTDAGVLLHWSTNSTPDNLGFNIYRVRDGQRARVNKEIIPGALFGPGTPALMRGGYSYSWFDRGGTPDSTYFIESVNVEGSPEIHQQALRPVVSKSGFDQLPNTVSGTSATESTNAFEKYFPAAESQLSSPQGTIQQQWVIAGQAALKIAIKKDGWYRVTQPEMVAAGFNPTVDIRNLRLFVDASEVAIATNQLTGSFGSGDYIEFYGRGLDTPTTDTRIYYLIAGTTPGKRVAGEIQLDAPPGPTSTPPPVLPPTTTTADPLLRDPVFYSFRTDLSWLLDTEPRNRIETQSKNVPIDRSLMVDSSAHQATPEYSEPDNTQARASYPLSEKSGQERTAGADSRTGQNAVPLANATRHDSVASSNSAGGANNVRSLPLTRAAGKVRRISGSRKKTRRKLRRQPRQEHSHALAADGFAPTNFDNTFQIKDRGVYLSNLLNGDIENFFGAVISSPVTLTLTLPNPDFSAAGSATLEFALQGVMSQFGNPHQVSVAFNGNTVGVVDFAPLEHPVRSFSIPVTQLLSGANTLKFTKTSTGEVCIVDYVRLTYPHVFKADSGSLKFNLRGSQTRQVDGFSTPLVRLIDYTDPLAVSIVRPAAEPSAAGYAITVPTTQTHSKDQRLLLAIPEGQFDQAAALTLNQPSTLNLNANAADFLVISHKNFIPSFTANISPINTSFVAQRQGQGHSVSLVDIDDVYDEFSYGLHGPQAIKDFLQHAFVHWATPPRYVIFAGDASFDPRNYTGAGNWDLVPTKLVDATYNETCSDDWLTDFDDDGIADIPVGRLPFRTLSEANLVISKIVNFAVANVPQSALLVADDPAGYYFDFEIANDQLQPLLTPSLIVRKAYRGLEIKSLAGTVNTSQISATVTGTGTLFTSELHAGDKIARAGQRLGTVASVTSNTTLTLTANANVDYTGVFGKQDDATARADIIAEFNSGKALANYSGHGNVDVWTGGSIFTATDAFALTNGNKLSFVVVMDCLNGYFQDPTLESMSEAFLKAPSGGAVAAFASSGLTLPDGQHQMSQQLYTLLYGAQSIALGDAIKSAKNATADIDVKRTWVFFGDPSMKIR